MIGKRILSFVISILLIATTLTSYATADENDPVNEFPPPPAEMTAVPDFLSTVPGTGCNLAVSTNGRFLVKNDGTPFFWLADTSWVMFRALTRENMDTYFENRAAKEFNVILATCMPWGGANVYGHSPFVDGNPTVPAVVYGPDNDYWDNVDYAVNKAESLGMYMALLPTWGVSPVFNTNNAYEYGLFLGSRYKDKPVIWIMGGDTPVQNEAQRDIWRALAKGIAIGVSGVEDYRKVLMAYHPTTGTHASQFSGGNLHDDAWLDFEGCQSGHGLTTADPHPAYSYISTYYDLTPVKPSVDLEINYEGFAVNWSGGADGYFNAYDVRKASYWSVFAGGFGISYGADGIWDCRDVFSALDYDGAFDMKFIKNLMESRPFLTRIPSQEIVTGGLGSGLTHVQATRSSDGSYAMVYIPTGEQTVTIDMSAISGETVNAWWFNPRDGLCYMQDGSETTASFGQYANSGTQDFTTPVGLDWVLVLDDAANTTFSQPGTPMDSGTPGEKCDLAVTGISWTPEHPVADNRVTFSATVTNQGTGASPAGTIHSVSFQVDGAPATIWSDNYTSSIAPGESVSITASGGVSGPAWTATAGTHSVTAVVDDTNKIAESDESNNSYSENIAIGIGQCDLIVTDISWTPGNPGMGDPVTFKATIKNQGEGVSPAGVTHRVAFQLDGAGTTIWSDYYASSIAAGASVTLTASRGTSGAAWFATSGIHSVTAVVDDMDNITESDESNNSYSENIAIEVGQCDLIVTDISWTPESPELGDQITFKATVKNQGTGASPAGVIHRVAFQPEGAGTIIWSDYHTSSIAAGASVTVTANGGTAWSVTKTGTLSVTAIADDLNRITESNETNNSYTKSMVIPRCDLIVADISWTPESPVAGDRVTFKATVKNQGAGRSPEGIVHGVAFQLDGAGTTIWSDYHTSSIEAGASVTLTAIGGVAGHEWIAAPGTHSVRATVDDVNRIQESNNNNNHYTKNIVVSDGGGTVDYSNAGSVTAVLGQPLQEYGLVLMRMGDGDPVESEIDGVHALKTDKTNGNIFLYFDVDDSFIYGGNNEVEIEVEYYDDYPGIFGIGYDGSGTANGTSGVRLTGTNQWLKTTFTIPDVEFAGGINNADFRVGLYTSVMGAAGSEDKDISIRSVTVRKPVQDPLILQVSSTKFGNIFTQDEQMILNLELNNTSFEPQSLKVDYSILDESGAGIKSGTINDVQVNADSTETIALDFNDIAKYGIYSLSLNVLMVDSGASLDGVFAFSRILSENRDVSDGMFGVCTHFAQGKGSIEDNLTAAQQAGAKYIRDEMYWSHAEQTKGVLQILPSWDEYVDTALAKGIKPLVVLSYGNDLYNGGMTPTSDEDIAAFANYAKFIAEHFKDRVTHFEIWNEYNINEICGRGTEDAASYKKMLEACYNTIKDVYSGREDDVTIVGASTATNDLEWIEDLLIAEGYGFMDAVSDHPYTYPFSPESNGLYAKMTNLDALMVEYGGEHMPIWITELGWPTNTSARGISEYQSAIYGVQAHVLTKINNVVDKLFWYDLQNDGTDAGYTEDNFGLIRAASGEVVPGAAKKNYIAYSALTSKLLGMEYKESYNELDQAVRIYRFRPEASSTRTHDTLVLWTTGADKNVALDLGCETVDVSDMYGNKTAMRTVDGKLNLTLSEAPMYIEGVMAETVQITASQLQLESGGFNATPGSTLSINADFNGSIPQEGAKYRVVLPAGWQTVADVPFSFGDTLKQIEVAVPDSIAKGTYEIYLQAALNNNDIIAMVKVIIHIVDSFKIEVTPVPAENGEWDRWKIRTKIINNNPNTAISGKVSILEPVNWGAEVDYSATANSTAVVDISVPGIVDQGLYNVVMNITIDGETREIRKKISFLAAAKAEAAPVIDGVMDSGEWEASMAFNLNAAAQVKVIPDWTGVDELSGTGYLKWDNENLYLAVEVKDDVHSQPYTGANIWNGDGIQFCIDPYREVPGAKGWNEIGIALDDNGTVGKYRWSVVNGKTAGDFTGMDCSIVRNEEAKTTVYEALIPWKDILPDGITAGEGFDFGFSLLINEDDGSGRIGWMEYMSGIGENKDANAFGDAVLVGAVSEPLNNDAALKDLKVNGNTITGFAASVYEYSYSLPSGTTLVPQVTAAANDSKAAVTVTEASGLPGTTTVIVTAEDGTTTKTYKINFTVQSSGSLPTPAPAPEKPGSDIAIEEDKQGNVIIKLPESKPDPATGTVKSTLDSATLDKARKDIKGNEKVIVEIPGVKDAIAYTVEMPKAALSSADVKKQAIEIQTEFGSIVAPSDMFKASDLENVDRVSITIGKADTSGLDEEILSQIDGRPVVELTATADGKRIDWNNPEAPVTVSIDYTPTEEELKNSGHITIWYITGDGKVVSVPDAKYDEKSGKVVFTTTHFSKYVVAFVRKTFSDAGKVSWAQKQIEVLASKGIIDTKDSTYKPDTGIARGEFVSMLVKALGLTAKADVNFEDVREGDRYFEEISIAKKLGVAVGGTDKKFHPDDAMSRQEMMVFAVRALKSKGVLAAEGRLTVLGKFDDQADISGYAKQSIAILVEEGIVRGDGKNMNPRGSASKAEAAVIIYNLFHY